MTDWIDVSVTVRHGMPHWPDHPPVVLERVMDLGRGDECNVSRLAMGVHSGTFVEDFVYISGQAAAYLAETRVRTVGVDYLSVGGYRADGAAVHRTLLQAGIWIIEGLDLSPVTGGRYDMICLPAKLHGSDGAPARAILRPLGRRHPGQTIGTEAAP
jgi:kynurenine formamidase